MKNRSLILSLLFMLLAACALQAPAAQATAKGSTFQRTISSASVTIPKTDAQKIMAACDRGSAQTYLREAGETLHTSFFDFTISDVQAQANFGDLLPQEGHCFLTASVLVQNTFAAAEAIPVGNYDFSLIWEGGQAKAHLYAAEGMYPDQIDLAQKESLAGTLVFEIPRIVNKCQIVYQEIWDDHYEGSTYAFLCSI